MARNTFKEDEELIEPFNIKHLLRASGYIKKYIKLMILALTLSGLGGAFGLIAPVIVRRALDVAVPADDKGMLLSLTALLAGVYALSIVFTTVRSYIMANVSQDIIYDIRKDLFAHLQELPFTY